jgi:signal transduction histidine kinase
MKKMKIRTKLLIIIAIAIVPMIILNIFMIRINHQQVIAQEQKTNKDYAEAISIAFSNYLEDLWSENLAIGLHIIESPAEDPTQIIAYLKKISVDYPSVRSFAYTDQKGIITYSSNTQAIGISIADRDYYKSIVNGEEKVVSNLVVGRASNQMTIIVARAIRENGELKGITTANINVDKLGSVFPQNRMAKSSSFVIVDRNGMIVFRLGSSNLSIEKRNVLDDSQIRKSLRGETVYFTNHRGVIDGQKRVGASVPIREIGWASYATILTEEALQNANSHVRAYIITMIIIVLTSLALVIYFAVDLLKPIKVFQKASNEMACGDFAVRINMKREDEFGQTAIAFNKMAEGIEQYDKLKTQFFMNLSHELRTPLNVILASAQLINRIESNESCPNHIKIQQQLKIIRQNCFRLVRMVGNLIDLSKYDVGYLNIKFGNHDIVKLVEDITLSIVKYAETKEIEILFDTEVEEKIIACNPDAIERIVLNLLSNALKFTNANGNISVNLYDKSDHVEISVKDNGIGIPKEKLGSVFDRFEQVDNSFNRNHEGSGIGLSLAKALIEAHKGSVTVESEIGKGTEFIIKLPATILPEESSEDNIFNNSRQGLVERINIEFSDIYNFRDLNN